MEQVDPMKSSFIIYRTAALNLMLLLAIVVLGFVCGLAIGSALLRNTEASWKQVITSIPEPAAEILTANLDDQNHVLVYVKTQPGNVFSCNTSNSTCQQLIALRVPSDPLRVSAVLHTSAHVPPGDVVDAAEFKVAWGDTPIGVNIAIMKDGSIWQQIISDDLMDILKELIAGCVGAVAGFVVGIILVHRLGRRRKRQSV